MTYIATIPRENTSYEKFLIRHRVYCDHPGCHGELTPATRVIKDDKGRDICVCSFHAGIQEDQSRIADALSFI